MRQPIAAGAALSMMALSMSLPASVAAEPNVITVGQPRTLRIAYSDAEVAMSADGRYVVFTRWLRSADEDAPPTTQVYRRDIHTGTTRLVSADPTDRVANAGALSGLLAVSGDGRYVAFASRSTNLTRQSADGRYRILVRDMNTRAVVAVPGTTEPTPDYGAPWSFSADGRYLAFMHRHKATDSAVRVMDIYRWERGNAESELISQHHGTAPPVGMTYAWDLSMSSDGRYVAFTANATDLLPGQVVSGTHGYLRDTVRGTTRLIDRVPGGAPSAAGWAVALSGDGRYALVVGGTDLVGGRSKERGLYRRDLTTGRNEPIVLPQVGAPNYAYWGRLSHDGRYVAFVGKPRVDDSDENQVYVRDMQHRMIRRVSATPTGGFVLKYSRYYSLQKLAMSADGRFVAFVSSFSELASKVPGDANGDPYYPDVIQESYTSYRVGPLHSPHAGT